MCELHQLDCIFTLFTCRLPPLISDENPCKTQSLFQRPIFRRKLLWKDEQGFASMKQVTCRLPCAVSTPIRYRHTERGNGRRNDSKSKLSIND